jgi:hypothetical protein
MMVRASCAPKWELLLDNIAAVQSDAGLIDPA